MTESRVHARALVEFGRVRGDAVVLSADLTSSTEADDFRAAYPDRFITMGMAEQNMMGVAGGLARQGLLPLCHDFAVFMYRRALDQVEMAIAYPNLPVVMVGFLPGITTPGGVSHQAINDVAVMRSIPNMRILECGDATDVESALEVGAAQRGPVYLRMIRGAIPRLFSDPMRFGTARVLSEGDEALVLSSGVCTEHTMTAVGALAAQGIQAAHLHVTTLKPFDDPLVIERLQRTRRGIVTVENHSTTGGLGSAVAELMAEHSVGVPLRRLGLQDTYAHGASKDYLMHHYGMDSAAVVEAVAGLVGALVDTSELVGAAASSLGAGQPTAHQETPDEAL